MSIQSWKASHNSWSINTFDCFKINRAIAIKAPVLPALTQASTVPFSIRSIATLIDESFLCRSAVEGESSILMTSDECVIEIRSKKVLYMNAYLALSEYLSHHLQSGDEGLIDT